LTKTTLNAKVVFGCFFVKLTKERKERMKNVLAMVLAGGKGSRLYDLTDVRSKPAVEFGGKWRLIDFALNNIFNSEINKALVLTQTKQQSLVTHLTKFWAFDPLWNRGALSVPAQQKIGEEWYRGTADAVFQNLNMLEREDDIDTVAILGADHVYKLDFRTMQETHVRSQADFTICVDVVRSEDAKELGVVQVDENFRIIGFCEKPEFPEKYEIPGRPGFCFVSMGIYLVGLEFLKDVVTQNAINPESGHDFGKDIIPSIICTARVFAHDFTAHTIKGERGPYWRDVGTLRSFLDCHMDLTEALPLLKLDNYFWPMRTYPDGLPNAKTVYPASRASGFLLDSGGCVKDAAYFDHVVLGRKVHVTRSEIEYSVLLSNVKVQEGCRIRNTIIDKNVEIPPRTRIGYSAEEDTARRFRVVDGITLVPKGYKFS
jgi:glucose-1-phosphate adenylyltransferase